MDIRRGFAIDFDEANNNLIALLGFLERQHANTTVADLEQCEFSSERAGMFCAFKSDERLVEAGGLPIGLGLTPITGMAGQPTDDFIVSHGLRQLIAVGSSVSRAHARRIDKSQAQGAVVRLV